MTDNELKKNAKVLRRYQDWRTGRDIRTLDEANLLPADLTGRLIPYCSIWACLSL